MTLTILNKKEKQEIEEKLNNQFGIKEISEKIIMKGKEKLFLFSGSFTNEEIKKLEELVVIEKVGVYFAKIDERTNDLRLSIEGSQIFKNQINKNVFEISEELVEQWMKGRELNIKTGKKGFIVIKYKDDFLGTGKASEEKISNFIPKIRRLKEKN
jgi:NOL1/NOP2/fmu family ribosome biogenesis protein|tara:strand:+ start:881 stop:1348 length:468 start_codon:yes stop_codon:yes gene_type:complete